MTREEAIKEYVIPALRHTWNEKINKEVLEALELEPVLDKIRAEIKELQTYFHEMLILDEVMQIIDKYKAEIELQESEV